MNLSKFLRIPIAFLLALLAGFSLEFPFAYAQTVPGAPTGLTATGGDAQVMLNWTAPASDGGSAITNYKVYRGTSPDGELFLIQISNTTSYTDAEAPFGTGGAVQSDPTSEGDEPAQIAADSQYLYIAGYQATGGECSTGGTCWRIEKRDITSGTLVSAFDGDGVVYSDPTADTDKAISIAVDSTYLYVAGQQGNGAGCTTGGRCWRIEKRDKTTGALVSAFDGDGVVESDPTSGEDIAQALAIDSSYIYITGDQATGAGCSAGFSCFRIEKRDITTGALVSAFDGDGIAQSDTAQGDWPRSITVDSASVYMTGYIANTGTECTTGLACWYIEKRDKTTGALVSAFDGDGILISDPTSGNDIANAIRVDSSYVYVAGYETVSGLNTQWRTEKRNITTGALVTAFDGDGIAQSNPTTGDEQPGSIALDSNYIYISGYQAGAGGCTSYCWRIEKRDLTTGALISAFDGDGVAQSDPTAGTDIAQSMVADSQYLYITGYQATGGGCGTGGNCWRIEKRNIVTGALISGLVNGTTYYYKVSAVNAIGESVLSNEASATPQAAVKRTTFYLQQDDTEAVGGYNTMTLSYPTYAGNDISNVDTAVAFTAPPCEGNDVLSVTTQIQADMDAITGEKCIATFFSPVLGQANTISTTQTDSIKVQFSAGRPSTGNNGAVTPKIRLYKYDGTYTLFLTLTGTALGTTVAAQTITGTPSTSVSLSATDRIVAVFTGDITVADSSSQTDYFQFDLNTAASLPYINFENIGVSTANRPDLTAPKDDDFTTYSGVATCTNMGVTYNTKWTCTTPTGIRFGDFLAHHHPTTATVGDATSWLVIEDWEDGTLGTNFGTSPENTYMYQSVDTSAESDGTVTTVVNAATRANSSGGNPQHHAGLLLWTSNTDYMEVQVNFNAGTQTHVAQVNQNGTLSNAANLSSNLVWLRWSKAGTTYTPQYSMNGSTWNDLGSGIVHANSFTRAGLTVYTSQTNGRMGAAFEYFDYTPSPRVVSQSGYRWYANANSADVGAPLAAQNTTTTAPAQGTPFRLRLLLHTATASIIATDDVFTKLSNADVMPGAQQNGTAWSADGTYLAAGGADSPFIRIYKRTGDAFVKLANPDVLPGSGVDDVSFSPDGVYLATGGEQAGGSGYLQIYKRSGDTFSKLVGQPDVGPPSYTNDVSFSPDGIYLAAVHNTSPYVYVYKRTGDAFAKLANPEAPAGTSAGGVSFSPDGTYLAVAHNASPFVTIYKRSEDTFTKLAGEPDVLPAGVGYGPSWSPDGTYLAVGHAVTPFVTIYKRSGDDFAKIVGQPETLPVNEGWATGFSPDGAYLAVGHPTTPFVTIYERTGDAFAKVTDPVNLPTGIGTGPNFSSNGGYLAVAHAVSPFLTIYREPSTHFRLQYAAKGGGTCASPSGTYTNLLLGAGDLRFADNSTPIEGAALTTNINDPTHDPDMVRAQTYQENLTFTNPTTIAVGEDGKWDFTLTDFSAPAGTTYCLRAIHGNGGAALNAYDQYPEITTWTPPPLTTTIGNGTDPSSVTIAPGASATMLDAFTFQTSSGTDTITAATTTLSTGSSGGLSLVEITNDGGSVVHGSVSNPSSDTFAITLATNITASTTLIQYKIRITPKSHANMPAPPGSSYAVTATVTGWTGTNPKAGSDSSSATVTVDNLSPGAASGISGSIGSGTLDILFSRVSGTTASATVTISAEGSTQSVTVSPQGTIK